MNSNVTMGNASLINIFVMEFKIAAMDQTKIQIYANQICKKINKYIKPK